MTLLYPNPPLAAYPIEIVRNGQAGVNSTYSSGADWSIKLDRIGVLLRSELRLKGEVATGATANGTARTRNPLLLLGNKIGVRINGKEEQAAHPDLLYLRACWRRGRNAKPERDSLTTTEMDTDSTSYTFSVILPFDFAPPGLNPDHVGAVICQNTPDIELFGTWGAVTAVASSTTNHAIANTSFLVFNERVQPNLTPDERALGFGHYVCRQIEKSITATETLQIELPGGKAYSAIYFRAEAAATPEPSDSVFTDATGYIRIKRGSTVLYERSLAAIKADTVSGLEYGEIVTGWRVVDFLKRPQDLLGIMSRVWITQGSQPLLLEVDVTSSTGAKLHIMTEELVDPVASANQRYRM